jgi:hypothetical protein
VSDIDIRPSYLDIFLIFSGWYVIPIAIVTALVAFWFYKTRSRTALGALIIAAIPCIAGAFTRADMEITQWRDDRAGDAYVRSHTRTLPKGERVAGALLPAGTVVEVADDGSAFATFRSPTTVFGVPITGDVQYDASGLTGTVTIARATPVGGILCAAGKSTFEHGALQTCTLARAQTIDGIPCRGEIMLGVDRTVACTTSRPFALHGVRVAAGTEFLFDSITVKRGFEPSLRVHGEPLRPAQQVYFDRPGVKIMGAALTRGTCDIDQINAVDGNAQGLGYDIAHQRTCSLALPKGTVRL